MRKNEKITALYERLSRDAFGLECGTDFTAGVSGIILVHDVAERGKIIVPSGTVHAVIDGDKANATLTQHHERVLCQRHQP